MTKSSNPLRPRVALLIGAAFLATPAIAQDAPAAQTVTPPPILTTPAPAPAAPAARPIQMEPSTPIVQPAPPPGPRPGTEVTTSSERATTTRTTRAAEPRQATRTTTRTTTSTATRQPAPAPAAAPAAPVAQTPTAAVEPAAPPVVTPAPEAAAPAPAAETTTQQTETSTGGLAWPWLLGGLLLILAGATALLLMRRRREPEYVDETVYDTETPRAYETPIAAEPIVAPRREPELAPYVAAAAAMPVVAAAPETVEEARTEAELAEPEREDLAGVTDAPAPVSNRPWLEFGLRPVRAGTSEEEALVDVELTVGNAGDVPARDVRISAFMLADAESSEMEGLLTGRTGDTAVPPVTIAPGDGTRIDAHLAVPKGEMGRVFNPVVVAEARYTLPDGREGRTSAAFKIGRTSPVMDGVGPIGATRPHMVDDVEAELLGTPEHA
ncbi:hypothetical protein FHS95_002409 [Sphingomonas naasensis]|uniref:LPXTG cell wall anchor domain-containing protein n=1 Tax=Sphingomonas naasensis TaxID=1344951 RepID=A0A4V3QWM4_9SPHN|nr:hypothetical protein [Sphingomonas naasensis]NIJ20717.1 hypothetical protein [Sphingomonas naasensis]TGX43132.1 hypothetical protein E5A74_08090 [Sphingomonas naasensis]